jgi:hypothetical protein
MDEGYKHGIQQLFLSSIKSNTSPSGFATFLCPQNIFVTFFLKVPFCTIDKSVFKNAQ